MTGNKGISFTFRGFGETGNAAKLPQIGKIRLATCQQLMDIRLVTHIKNQAVFHCIEHSFDGNRKLHRAQIGSQMATGLRHAGNQEIPNLRAKNFPLCIIQMNQIIVTCDI